MVGTWSGTAVLVGMDIGALSSAVGSARVGPVDVATLWGERKVGGRWVAEYWCVQSQRFLLLGRESHPGGQYS